MANRPSLDDYIDVAERVLAFKEKHPEGSLQTVDWQPVEVGGRTFIVYRAAAYRTPDDPRPGHGTAWEPFPGPTPYTKDSELMNAETAAWGRAIVAVGIAANRKIASRQEVQGRATAEPPLLDDNSVQEVLSAIRRARMGTAWLRKQLVDVGAQNVPDGQITKGTIQHLTAEQAVEIVKACDAATDQQAAAE